MVAGEASFSVFSEDRFNEDEGDMRSKQKSPLTDCRGSQYHTLQLLKLNKQISGTIYWSAVQIQSSTIFILDNIFSQQY